jgi:L-seryl-tRNA(Ser) seleniumtransferase
MAAQAPEKCAAEAGLCADGLAQRLLQPVINGTGTLLHTNLGRAPRVGPLAAPGAPATPGSIRYSNLEFDLETGQRGSRRNHASALLATLSGAESALVVNNCAAALMLVIAALARGRGVAVSRSELIEIGGAFRIPDVLTSQGASLVEVGTTNRTRAEDFERALSRGSANVGMVLSVHRSNYSISGFTESPTIAQLSAVSQARRVPLVVDTGSGLLDSRLPWLADAGGRVPSLPWLAAEPGSKQTLEAGADVIVFSGDKLMGGPQCGIVAGRKDLVDQCAQHPLARALRPGGSVLGELQQVCLQYLNGDARSLPFWEMACRSVESLRTRAEHIAASCNSDVSAVACISVPGGGTLPDAEIPSYGVLVPGNHLGRLRKAYPPVIARTQGNDTLIDLRTVDPLDDQLIVELLATTLNRQ